MKREKGPPNKNQYSTSREFSITRYHLVRHIFALILIGGLCFALVMSELSYHMHPHAHHSALSSQIIVSYSALLVFVSIIAITTILTACKIKISREGVEISNLFWHEKLANTDLQTFRSPANFIYAWLKTKHGLYLLAKSEFKDWSELENALQEQLSNH